jgi:hypothetical protein
MAQSSGPFTTAQQEILTAMNHLVATWIEHVHERMRTVHTRLVALEGCLIERGLVSGEVLGDRIRELHAAAAVDTLFDPEIRAANDELRRLLSENQPEES